MPASWPGTSASASRMSTSSGSGVTAWRPRVPSLIAHVRDLAVVGLFEVLRHVRYLRGVLRSVLEEVDRHPPALAVLVDYAGFNLRLGRQLHARGVPIAYYVSPGVGVAAETRTHDPGDRLAHDGHLPLRGGPLPGGGCPGHLRRSPARGPGEAGDRPRGLPPIFRTGPVAAGGRSPPREPPTGGALQPPPLGRGAATAGRAAAGPPVRGGRRPGPRSTGSRSGARGATDCASSRPGPLPDGGGHGGNRGLRNRHGRGRIDGNADGRRVPTGPGDLCAGPTVRERPALRHGESDRRTRRSSKS